MLRSSLLAILFSLLLAQLARAQVSIDRAEPVIERKTFDPHNPPADMPKLNPTEAAVTQSFFGAESRVGGDVVDHEDAPEGFKSSIKVDTVQMTLRLRITLWLPKGGSQKLINHEEGHRELAERFYKEAERIAREQSEKLIGQTITGRGKDAPEAGDNALRRAAEELGQRYLGRTDVPCGKAQKIYDEITAHGTNATPEAKAVEEAIKRVTADRATSPAANGAR